MHKRLFESHVALVTVGPQIFAPGNVEGDIKDVLGYLYIDRENNLCIGAEHVTVEIKADVLKAWIGST